MSDRDPDEEFNIELTSDESEILAQGLYTWAGPAQPTDNLARVMGFRNVLELHAVGSELGDRIRAGATLSRRDWSRAIMCLEVAFGSDAGAGWEWSIVTGFDDDYTLRVLRTLQHKLVGIRLQRDAIEPVA